MKTFCNPLSLSLGLGLMLSWSAAANPGVSGYCQQGNQAVVTPTVPNSTTRVQRSYPGCTVTVYLTGTVTLATIYSDDGVTVKANPFTASLSTGFWNFYTTNNQVVDVQMSGAGISTPFTLPALGRIQPTLYDTSFTSLTAACSKAASTGLGLTITQTDAVALGFTCAAPSVTIVPGGLIQPASGQTVTLPPNTQCPQLQQCFDLHLSGVPGLAFSAAPAYITPHNVGAKCDNSTDDTNTWNYALTLANIYGIPLVFPGCESYVSGQILLSSATINLTLTGAGGANPQGDSPGISTIRSGDTSGSAVMAITSTNQNEYVNLSGFKIVCSGASSGDGLLLSSNTNAVSGQVHNIRVTNCKGSGKAAIHTTSAEGLTIGPAVAGDDSYDGLLMDTASNNDTIINFQGSANSNAGIHSIRSGANHFSAPVMQSNAYGCILNGDDDLVFDAPYFENNSVNSCTMTNEAALQMIGVHHSYLSGAGMTITNTGSSPLASGLFTGTLNSTGGVSVTINDVLSSGNTWISSMVPSNFSGTGATPFRENLLGFPQGGGASNGGVITNNNAGQQTKTCTGTCSVDLSAQSNVVVITLTGNSTLSVTNFPQVPGSTQAGGTACFQIISAGHTWTWPAGFHGALTVTTTGYYGQCFTQTGSNNWYATSSGSGPN